MPTLGIIGGLGTITTALFYRKLTQKCLQLYRQTPQIIIYSINLDEEDYKFFVNAVQSNKKVLEKLQKAVNFFEQIKVDYVVVPCNSVYTWLQTNKNSFQLIHIVDEVVQFLKNNNCNEITILSSASVIKNQLYSRKLECENIKAKTLKKEEQTKVESLINRNLMQKTTKEDKIQILKIINNIETKCVLLGCTDLQNIVQKQQCSKTIYDSLEILLDGVLKRMK